MRGPVVTVPRHRNAIDSTDDLLAWVQSRNNQGPLAVDLFCGAGGLSVGLSDAGYDVVLGVDNDETALETYASLHPGMTLCRDLGDPEVVAELAGLISELGVEIIVGGPPCQPFSRAGSSKIRSLVQAGVRPDHDDRRDLWQAFLDVVKCVKPRAVLLENVPDMALAPDTAIVRSLVSELEVGGYAVHTAVLRAGDYGVPQLRRRFLMVALSDGTGFEWPEQWDAQVTVGDAIRDLPSVEGGWRSPEGAAGFLDYMRDTKPNKFVRHVRKGLRGARRDRIYDHITRPVRDDDRKIFESMDSTTRYSEIDESLKRYRDDIFDDKYKRLDWNRPSRSITAHIARDGYWYIHPEQTRTLTIREAARLQTFPDRVRFAGPPSAAFRQIGNAVPPRLAECIAHSIRHALDSAEPAKATSTAVSKHLATWFENRESLSLPWLKARTSWSAAQGHLLLDRAPNAAVATAWPTLEKLDNPQRTVETADQLKDLATLIGRPKQFDRLLETARWGIENADALADAAEFKASPHMGKRLAQVAALVDPCAGPTPVVVTQATLRVASRVFGVSPPQRRLDSQGRLAVTRLLEGTTDTRPDRSRHAMAAVLELAGSLCRPRNPLCSQCPLSALCEWSQNQVSSPSTS